MLLRDIEIVEDIRFFRIIRVCIVMDEKNGSPEGKKGLEQVLERQKEKVESKVSQELGKDKKISVEELTETLQKEGKKLISVKELSQDTVDKLKYSLKDLEKLRSDIVSKIEEIVVQASTMQKKVQEIKTFDKIKFNEDEEKKSMQATQQYMLLLQNLLGEVTQQLQYFAVYFSDKKPEKIIVPQGESNDFSEYMFSQIKGMRKYIKNVSKNLNVIFSRHQVSFKAQINNLEYLERYLKTMQKAEKK